MTQIMEGIRALHRHNILHLDIKPENILFETGAESACIKITDFGLSRLYKKEKDKDKEQSKEAAARRPGGFDTENVENLLPFVCLPGRMARAGPPRDPAE